MSGDSFTIGAHEVKTEKMLCKVCQTILILVWHPIQGRLAIFVVTTETGISSGMMGHLGSYADFNFLVIV